MWGDILQVVGLLALLHWSGKLLVAVIDRRQARLNAIAARERLYGYSELGGEAPCAWPQEEPELAQLRARGGL